MRPAKVSALLTMPVLLALCGCAKTVDFPPTITLGARVCPRQIDTSQAKSLAISGKAVSVEVDANFPCVAGADNEVSLYTAFRLPQSQREYFISVTSQPRGSSLFAPKAMLLDAQGTVLRQIPRDTFVFHGN